MKNGKFIKTTIQMQDEERWSEYPSYGDNAASHSFRCGVYGLIAILTEKILFKRDVDQLKVLGSCIFHDINETRTGPIKHNTKKNEKLEKHIRKLEKEWGEEILNYLSGSLRPLFREFIVNAEDNTYEGRLMDAIDTFDALVFCHRENVSDGNPHFEETFIELKKRLEKTQVDSVKWMMQKAFGEEKDENLYNFIMYVMSMDRIRRWKGKNSTIEDHDALHTYRATAIALVLGSIEKYKKKIDIDLFTLAAKTLCHDLPEAITGDVLGPVKHSSPETKEAFEHYEKEVAESMVELLPVWLREKFHFYMVEAKDDTYEGEWVDLVDKIDALIKTQLEFRNGQRDYEHDYRKILRKLQSVAENYPGLEFFLSYILHDLYFHDKLFENED